MGPPVVAYMAGSMALIGSGCLFKKHVFDPHLEPWISSRKEVWKQEAANHLNFVAQGAHRQLDNLAQGAHEHLQNFTNETHRHAETLAQNAQGCLVGFARGTQEQLGAAKQGAAITIQAVMSSAQGTLTGLKDGAAIRLERVQHDFRRRGERAGFIPILAEHTGDRSSPSSGGHGDDRPMGWGGRSDTFRTDDLLSMETADGSEMIVGQSVAGDVTALLHVEMKDSFGLSTAIESSIGGLSRRHVSTSDHAPDAESRLSSLKDWQQTPVRSESAEIRAGDDVTILQSAQLSQDCTTPLLATGDHDAGPVVDLDRTPLAASSQWVPSASATSEETGAARFATRPNTPSISLVDTDVGSSWHIDDHVFSALTSPQAPAPDLMTLSADGASDAGLESSSSFDLDFSLSDRTYSAPFSPASALGFSMIFPLDPRTLALSRTTTRTDVSAIDDIASASPSPGSVISLPETDVHRDTFSESSEGWSEL